MKRSFLLSFAILMVMFSFNSYAQSGNKKTSNVVTPVKVEAYYFHLTSRCETCKAVEAEAKKDLQSLYGDKVSFKAINLDDASSKAIAEKLQVSGQALLVVKGSKILNLTNEGFMYARKEPAKFKAVIKEKVDPLVK